MNTKLRNLSLYLKSIGLNKESSLILRFAQKEHNLDTVLEEFMKMDSLFSEEGEEGKEGDSLAKADLDKWEKLLEASRGESTFHYEISLSEISEALSSESNALRSNFNIPVGSDSDREEALNMLRSKSFLTDNAEDQDFDRSNKIEIDYDEIYKNINDTIQSLLSDLPENEAGLVLESMQKGGFEKEAVVKQLGSKVLKAIPYAGIAFTFSLFVKNLVEAQNNATIIMESLPLSKYGLSAAGVMTTAFLINGTYRHLEKKIEENSDNPDNLMEILEIISVIKVYHLDVLNAITNGIALVLDIISWVLTGFPELISSVAGVLLSVADFIFQVIVLAGIEIGAEYASDWYWDPLKEKIADITESAIKQIKGGQLSIA